MKIKNINSNLIIHGIQKYGECDIFHTKSQFIQYFFNLLSPLFGLSRLSTFRYFILVFI